MLFRSRLLHVETDAAEDQGAGKGGRGAEGIEVDLLAREVAERPDLGPDEDVQFGGKQIEDIGEAALDVGHLGLVLLERIC